MNDDESKINELNSSQIFKIYRGLNNKVDCQMHDARDIMFKILIPTQETYEITDK